MLQDINPHHFEIGFEKGEGHAPQATDLVVAWNKDEILLCWEGEAIHLPSVGQCLQVGWSAEWLRYLFTLDEQAVYYIDWSDHPCEPPEGSAPRKAGQLRGLSPRHQAFAALVSAHLHRWYDSHHFCGHCGQPFRLSPTERALICPECGLVEYPRINPAVIIAVTDGDKLLLSHYADRPHRRWALLAGYCEAGESLEATVLREVQEEVGLQVTNLRYYKSQPWPFSDSLLMGFYCDAVGEKEPHVDGKELAEACWIQREDLPIDDPSQLSLTQEMIATFKKGMEPK